MHNPDTADSEQFEIEFYGVVYPGNFASFLDWSVYYYGAYAKPELACMRDLLTPIDRPQMIDIGANVGHHTLFASTIAGHVHAFEPYPPLAGKIREKIRINGITNIDVHEVGLGEKQEKVTYYPSYTSNTGIGSFAHRNGIVRPEDEVELNLARGDDYFTEHGITTPHFIKIDVEGMEISVLKGLRKTLYSSRPMCLVEWNRQEQDTLLENGKAIFPPGYYFYTLNYYNPRFYLFNTSDYTIEKAPDCWSDGMILAIPEEYSRRT